MFVYYLFQNLHTLLYRHLHGRSPVVDFVTKQALTMFENQARKGKQSNLIIS